MNDKELLCRFVHNGSQEAFAELVRLRLGLVYSLALRLTGGDSHRAEEVAQVVFTDLAHKAGSLCHHNALIGWLYTSTRYTATNMARSELRRAARDSAAFTMQEDRTPSVPEVPAEKLRPLLDEAMVLLPEPDRRAILHRFFEGCSMIELGQFLGISESTAKKRVERALGKLRTQLAKRGLTSTAAAIGAALAQEAAAATAPAGLAATISGNAVLAAATAGPGFALISIMTAAKLPTLVGATAIIGLLSIGSGLYEWRNAQRAGIALEAASRRYDAENKELAALRQNERAAADLEKKAAGTKASGLPAKSPASTAEERWRKLTAAYPEVSRMTYDLSKPIMGSMYRLYFEHAGFTAAQIDEIESHLAASAIQDGGTPDHTHSYEVLRKVLGDQGAKELKDYQTTFGDANSTISRIATDAGIATSPITSEQELRLAAIIDENTPTNKDNQGKEWTSVDWTRAGKQAQNLLSPAQWKAAEQTFLDHQYQQALQQAQKNSISTSSLGAGVE